MVSWLKSTRGSWLAVVHKQTPPPSCLSWIIPLICLPSHESLCWWFWCIVMIQSSSLSAQDGSLSSCFLVSFRSQRAGNCKEIWWKMFEKYEIIFIHKYLTFYEKYMRQQLPSEVVILLSWAEAWCGLVCLLVEGKFLGRDSDNDLVLRQLQWP